MVTEVLTKFPAFLVTERTSCNDEHNPYYGTLFISHLP